MNTLVIDDDPVSRLAVVDLVRRFDLGSCGEVESGTAAWKHLETNPPPLLICCDVRMPGLSGIEFLANVKSCRDFERIPFVLVTSATDSDVVQEAVKLGASGYIVKPFAAEEARKRLQTILLSAWTHIAEDPANTLERLSIAAPKLQVYYSAFRRQIDDALALIASGSETLESTLPGRLDALQTGCLTLGLWHGARIIDRLKSHSNPSGGRDYLAAVGQLLDQQRSRTRDGSWRRTA